MTGIVADIQRSSYGRWVVVEAEVTTDMTGTLSRQGQTLVMSGTMFSGESGMGMYADWEVTK